MSAASMTPPPTTPPPTTPPPTNRTMVDWADFTPGLARPAALVPLTGKPALSDGTSPRPASAPDIAALLEAAREEGRREGEARAAESAARLQAVRDEEARASLAAERLRWSETEASALATMVKEQVEVLEERLAANVARILLPFLADGLRRQALRELRSIVAPLIEGGCCATLTVSGPEDLVTRLAERLGLAEGILVTRFDGGPDIRVQVNDTVVETRLHAWSERLRRLLEEE